MLFLQDSVSVVFSSPSRALLALVVPLTGLGQKTAIIALVIYNQYLLLRNFLAGLNGVDPAIMEATAAMGMTHMQRLVRVLTFAENRGKS